MQRRFSALRVLLQFQFSPLTAAVVLAILVISSGESWGAAGEVPPVITEQPQPQTSFVGANVNLHVSAASPTGTRYRWLFFGTNLPGNFPGQFTTLLQLRN